MKVSTDPQSRDALARQLLASQKRIVVFGQAQQSAPPRQKSVRGEFVDALAALAAKRQKARPVESTAAQAERARNVELFTAKLKLYRAKSC